MGISVIALIFAVIVFCRCKWGPDSWGQTLFAVATGLMLAAMPFGQQAADMILDLMNNLFGGWFA